MSTVEVRVRLFGAFRRYASDEVTVELPRGEKVGALRPRIAEALRRRCPAFADEALLEASVLADERRVLAEDDPIDAGSGPVTLAVLPPVCGG